MSKVSTIEMVNRAVKLLHDVRWTRLNGRQTLHRANSVNIVSKYEEDVIQSRVRLFCLKEYDVSARVGDGIYTLVKDSILRDRSKEIKGSILPITYLDDSSYAYIKVERPEAPIKLSDLPEFELFLSQASPEGANCIVKWIGSLLDPKSNRRQYLHLVGSGLEGKGSLIMALDAALRGQTISTSARSMQGVHFGPELESKRLITFGDENNTTFFSSGAFKALTGDDYMTINEKYRAARTIELIGKVLICSNNDIEITGNAADTSRLISVELTGVYKDNNWKSGLVASAVNMLLYCAQEYNAELETNPNLQMKLPTVQKTIDAAVERKLEPIADAVDLCIEIDPKRTERRSRVMEVLLPRLQGQGKPKELRAQIVEYLTQKGVTLRRDGKLGWVFEGVIVIND